MTIRSLRRMLAVLSLALAAMIAPVASASASCAALERQLSGIRASAGDGGAAETARRQRIELGEARRQSRAQRCDEDGGSQRCRVLLSVMAKMQAYLARLEARSVGDGSRGAARIRARMVEAGCTGATANKRKGKAILASIARTATGRRGPKNLSRSRPAKASAATAGGTFRTLCVRTCDGYFFPISFSTTADRFKDDAAACAARCPGMEVGLYAHPMPNADVETMVSALDGTPYGDLKTAFLYKLKGPSGTKACGCSVPVAAMAPTPVKAVTAKASAKTASRGVAIPTPRPDLVAELRVADTLRASVLSDASQGGTPARPVRVVGPSFFPDR